MRSIEALDCFAAGVVVNAEERKSASGSLFAYPDRRVKTSNVEWVEIRGVLPEGLRYLSPAGLIKARTLLSGDGDR